MSQWKEAILVLPKLLVIHNNTLWQYIGRYTNDQIPVYIPPNEKHANDNNLAEEFLFLPITEKGFKNRWDTNIGYQFIFKRKSSTTVRLLGNSCLNGTGELEMEFTIARIYYKTKGLQSIIIKMIRSPLFPPEIVKLDGTIAEITTTIPKIIGSVLSYYCEYYATHKI